MITRRCCECHKILTWAEEARGYLVCAECLERNRGWNEQFDRIKELEGEIEDMLEMAPTELRNANHRIKELEEEVDRLETEEVDGRQTDIDNLQVKLTELEGVNKRAHEVFGAESDGFGKTVAELEGKLRGAEEDKILLERALKNSTDENLEDALRVLQSHLDLAVKSMESCANPEEHWKPVAEIKGEKH